MMLRPRRRYQSPDGLDWRDPQMPVIGKSGREIDHRKMELKAAMALVDAKEPPYQRDPTYNLRKRRGAQP